MRVENFLFKVISYKRNVLFVQQQGTSQKCPIKFLNGINQTTALTTTSKQSLINSHSHKFFYYDIPLTIIQSFES